MGPRLRILVQTTIPRRSDDWSIDSLTLLRCELAAIDAAGVRVDVVARDRSPDPTKPDPVLSTLHESDFDELWLFALDAGEGLTAADCSGITRFRQRGGGILSTRDHQDNWDPALGCPCFVTEPAGDALKNNPRAAGDIRRYVRNLALWLAPAGMSIPRWATA